MLSHLFLHALLEFAPRRHRAFQVVFDIARHLIALKSDGAFVPRRHQFLQETENIELAAVERLFGNAAGKVSMSSTKSATGHLLGAAGAVEAIFSALAIRDQVAPPTLNLDNPSVATAIDLVPHQARSRTIDTVLSNSFGFGGTNASLILRRYDA